MCGGNSTPQLVSDQYLRWKPGSAKYQIPHALVLEQDSGCNSPRLERKFVLTTVEKVQCLLIPAHIFYPAAEQIHIAMRSRTSIKTVPAC